MLRRLLVSNAAVLFALSALAASATPSTAKDIMNAFCCTPGATATITSKGGGVPCFDSQEHMDAAQKAASENDNYGFADAARYATVLRAGERVRYLENASNWHGGAVRIRILTGSDAGVGCWVPGYMDNVVKDIQGE
jgi:hypothetical protein